MSVAIFAQPQLYLLATHQDVACHVADGITNRLCQSGAAVRAPIPTIVSVACGVRGSMDDAWDLEMELLCLPATGGSVRKMQRLAERIANACNDVPPHVHELGQIAQDSHRERDLVRWVRRQPWRRLLPEPFEFKLPYSPDGLKEDAITHAALLPHETFSSLSAYP